MKDQSEKDFEALRNKQLTRGELMYLTSAIEEVAKAISGHSAWDSLRYVRNTIRHLNEFRGAIVPLAELTEEEAEMSRALHTYMRKGMDCDLSVMMHRLIDENRGTPIWYAFVKGVTSNKINPKWCYREGIRAAEETYAVGSDTTDDLFMLNTLKIWGKEDFESALDWLKGK